MYISFWKLHIYFESSQTFETYTTSEGISTSHAGAFDDHAS